MVTFFRPLRFSGPCFFENAIGFLQSIGHAPQICFTDFESSTVEKRISTDGHYNLLISWGYDKRFKMDDAFYGEIRNDINLGKCRIFLDQSNEPGNGIVPRSQEYFSKLGIAPNVINNNIFFICQNRKLSNNIKNYIPFDAWFFRVFETFLDLIDSDGHRNLFTDRNRFLNSTHRYLCLNNKLRPHRILTLCLLHYFNEVVFEDSYLGKPSFISMPEFSEIPVHKPGSKLLDLMEFIDSNKERLPAFDKSIQSLINSVPIFLDGDPIERPRYARSIVYDAYLKSNISIVTETGMDNEALRITEKTFKALITGHPFVIVGTPGAVGLVRSFGFDVFDDFIDHNYDDIESPGERAMEAVISAKNFCNLIETDPESALKVGEISRRNIQYAIEDFVGSYLQKHLSPILECARHFHQ